MQELDKPHLLRELAGVETRLFVSMIHRALTACRWGVSTVADILGMLWVFFVRCRFGVHIGGCISSSVACVCVGRVSFCAAPSWLGRGSGCAGKSRLFYMGNLDIDDAPGSWYSTAN